jgi:hypothetical protein
VHCKTEIAGGPALWFVETRTGSEMWFMETPTHGGISAPAGTSLVTPVISVSGCLLKTGEPTGSETHTIDIPYNDSTIAAQVLEFQVNTPSKCLVITAARLIYKRFEYNTWVQMNK